MANRRRILTLSIPLIIFLAGCFFLFKGLYTDPRKLESVLVGENVPEFSSPDIYQLDKIHGTEIFKKQKLLLNVWATWCPTCYAEHQYLNQLAAEGIYIIGMNYKDNHRKAIKWLTDLKDPYQISLFDEKGMLGLDLGVYGAPETFFINSKGVIQYRHVGDINAQNWKNELSAIYENME